ITPTADLMEWAVPNLGPGATTGLGAITTGPDGNLWFVEQTSNRIGRITTSGTITTFPIPTANSGPFDITAGPGGFMWFTEINANRVARIATVAPHTIT